ncbi:putative membrane protein [Neolecta irregularis DAH-3]|uniref:Putative membrane protein n=1 Tax=Neolecta irregularis (strain DAH-3) TaxID=1198029 RepID=A0A1U7LMA2_NEOID|nr:putative membrane protein [Neolecta irregularis DAH-3]|eukprot:OLL23758.1 putative membrane protein [Neolecta irregularis DAH-3]
MNLYALSILISGVWADSLYVERTSECLENPAFILQTFNAVYHPENKSIVLDISGDSSIAVPTLYATLTIDTFGQQRFTQTFTPCSIGFEAFCPLTNGSFSTSGVLILDPADVPAIPALVYHLPDLDGNATLQFYNNATNANVVCIVASITNGNSLRHAFISWIALVVFALAAITSFFRISTSNANTAAQESMPSVYATLAFFQTLVLGASISVDYPRIAIAWASNFAWSCGFIYIHSLETMLNKSHDTMIRGLAKRSAIDSPGIPNPGIYKGLQGLLAQIGISTRNVFMTTFCGFLFLVAVVLGFLLLFRGILALLLFGGVDTGRMDMFRKRWCLYTTISIARLVHLCFFVVMWLAIFQFTLSGDSAFKGVAAIVFLIFLFTIGITSFYVYHKQRAGLVQSEPQYLLYTDHQLQNRWGWLYLEFRQENWWFFGIELAYQFIRAVFYSVGQNHPLGQAIIILALEGIAFLVLHVQRPFALYRTNLLFLGIQLFRVLNTAFTFFYVPVFEIDPIIQYTLALVCTLVQALCFVAMIAMTFWNLGSAVYYFITAGTGHQELGSGTMSSLSEKTESPVSSSRIAVRDSIVQMPSLLLSQARQSASSGESIDGRDVDRFDIGRAV